MKSIYVLTKREITAYFLSPMAYIFVTVFLILEGFVFMFILTSAKQGAGIQQDFLSYFFGMNNLWFWFFLFIMIPSITMRLLAEEKRSNTLEVLMTAPVTDAAVVISKYLGALAFFLFLWIPTFLYVMILEWYGNPDLGMVAASYFGIFLIGGFLISLGLLASSLTDSQVTSAIVSAAVMFVVFFLGLLPQMGLVNPASLTYNLGFMTVDLAQMLGYISLMDHEGKFARGYVDTQHIVFYVSSVVFFLFVTVKVLESRKWR